jgi:two-component system cell cycle response regulator DivK
MVVEDNELNLKLFCDLLRAHGYDADPVRDGRDALERARVFAPDLVVMDIQMPHVSGLELIEQMKADEGLRRTPIMAVTAYAAKGDEERIRDAGAEGYVSKPISVMRFVEAVRGLLEAGEPRADDEAPAAGLELPSAAAGDAAAAQAVQAAEQSVEIEEEVAAEGDEVAAKAVEASAAAEDGVAEAAAGDAAAHEATEHEDRHSREGGNPASGNDDGAEEELGPGSGPG